MESKAADNATNRFKAYLNYFLSISTKIHELYPSPDLYADQICQSPHFHRLEGGRAQNVEQIGKMLRNAWFTEIQVAFPSNYPSYIKYASHWVSVQAYYAAYLTLRAYFYSKGKGSEIGSEHATNLNVFSQEVRTRKGLFPYPFSCICEGDPYKAPIYTGFPPDIEIDTVSPLSSGYWVRFEDSFALLLKTTRKRKLDKLCDDWKKKEGRKRMCPNQKATFLKNMSPTSFFHVLYRMRVRSNYEDADSFLMSVSKEEESEMMYDSLRRILWHFLFLLEAMIAKQLGKKKYNAILDDFCTHEAIGLHTEMATRRRDTFIKKW